MLKRKQSGFIELSVVLLVLLLIGAGAYYFGKNQSGLLIVTPTPSSKTENIVQGGAIEKSLDGKSQIYTNRDYGLSFEIPGDWEIVIDSLPGGKDYKAEQNAGGFVGGVSIGPKGMKGEGYDGYFGMFVYDKARTSSDKVISDIGKQFADRKEIRQKQTINSRSVLYLDIRTPSHPDWISLNYVLETEKYIYSFGNGATNKFVDIFHNIASSIKLN